MAKSSRKSAPSDPQAITLRRAAEQAERRAEVVQATKDPRTWGIDAEQLDLPTSRGVRVHLSGQRSDGRKKVLEAKRLDPFEALFEARGKDGARGLSIGQHDAAMRLMQDHAERAGVRAGDTWKVEMIAANDCGELVSQRQIDAGRRIDEVLGMVGRADATLLRRLVEQVVFESAGVGGTAWRATVEQLTGEKDRHCQGSAVRRACENLRQAYAEIDNRPPPPPEHRPLSAEAVRMVRAAANGA